MNIIFQSARGSWAMGLKNQNLIKSQKYEMFERVKFGYFEDFWNGSCKASWYDIVFFSLKLQIIHTKWYLIKKFQPQIYFIGHTWTIWTMMRPYLACIRALFWHIFTSMWLKWFKFSLKSNFSLTTQNNVMWNYWDHVVPMFYPI